MILSRIKILLLALCLCLVPLFAMAKNISATSPEVAQMLKNPPSDLIILDIRTPEEFATGHLEGAILVDFIAPDFEDKLAKLDMEAPYVLYCRTGARSSRAMVVMEKLGFTNVTHMVDGITGWVQHKLPVKK